MVEGHDFGLPEFDQLLQLHWIDVWFFIFILGGGGNLAECESCFWCCYQGGSAAPKANKEEEEEETKKLHHLVNIGLVLELDWIGSIFNTLG